MLIAAVSNNNDNPTPAAANTQPTVTVTAQPSEAATRESEASEAIGDTAASEPSATPTTDPPKTKTGNAANSGKWTMPNEVGKDLQAAQDHIQGVTDNPFFFTDSADATGAAGSNPRR